VLERGAVPCGLGARDTLRLEVCYPLHGNDITPETDAISAGLGWVCALETEFTGVDELRRIKADGPEGRLAAVVRRRQAVRGTGRGAAVGRPGSRWSRRTGSASSSTRRRPRRARRSTRTSRTERSSP